MISLLMAMNFTDRAWLSLLAGEPISSRISQLCHLLALYGQHRDARSVGKGDHETSKTGILRLSVPF